MAICEFDFFITINEIAIKIKAKTTNALLIFLFPKSHTNTPAKTNVNNTTFVIKEK